MGDLQSPETNKPKRVHNQENTQGEWKTIRDAVETADGALPTFGTGQDFSDYKHLEVDLELGGTSPTCQVTPLSPNADGDGYKEGVLRKIYVPKNHSFYIENINGADDINFMINALTGTDEFVTIKARGYN